MTENNSIEPLTASMVHHPEYAKGWNAALEALSNAKEERSDHLQQQAEPAARLPDDAADTAVWALIEAAETCGAVKDEGEEGLFWTIDLHSWFALETKLSGSVSDMRHSQSSAPSISEVKERSDCPPAQQAGEAVAWQKRIFLGGKWGDWEPSAPLLPGEPLHVELNGTVAMEFRPLFLHSSSTEQPAQGVPAEPLKVFDSGMWIWKETGQGFSGAGLDEAAFVAYREAGLLAASGASFGSEQSPSPAADVPDCWPTGTRYSIEPYGNGYAIYRGRDSSHHGLNLAYIAEASDETLRLIERALNLAAGDVSLRSTLVPEDMVLVRKAAIDWLNGETDEGFECPPDRYFRGEPPRYWWRSVFREKAGLAAAPAQEVSS